MQFVRCTRVSLGPDHVPGNFRASWGWVAQAALPIKTGTTKRATVTSQNGYVLNQQRHRRPRLVQPFVDELPPIYGA